MVLDIRTGHVRGNALSIWGKNLLLTVECMFFSHITIISESLRRLLRIPPAKAYVVPPGADTQHFLEKTFDGLRLLYVGSLAMRRIHETVQGVDRFYREYGESVTITYDIVGFGRQEDEQRLREAIANSSCRDIVTFHGRIPNISLRPFLEKDNIGIAYIPIIPRYDCQPPLKLIEYLLAGMAVIATRTSENARLVNHENGVLVSDSPEGVYDGLKNVLGMLHAYKSGVIKSNLQLYTWEAIVRDNLRVYLLNILQLYKNAQH